MLPHVRIEKPYLLSSWFDLVLLAVGAPAKPYDER